MLRWADPVDPQLSTYCCAATRWQRGAGPCGRAKLELDWGAEPTFRALHLPASKPVWSAGSGLKPHALPSAS
eukprot:5260180-Alexandrium_andersonii.AAC.1